MLQQAMLAFFLSQVPDSNSTWQPPQRLVLGHRGAKAQEPENTLRSFEKAMKLGAHGIEFDVFMSADGVPFIIHDDTLQRTTNGKGNVTKRTMNELKELNAAKEWNSLENVGIPTLAETLEAMPEGAIVNIEMKGPGRHTKSQFADAVFEVMKPHRKRLFVIVSSFDSKLLEIMREKDEHLFIGYLLWEQGFASYWSALSDMKAVRPNALHISANLATPGIVRAAHEKGLKVLVWTVNDKEQEKRLRKNGVDGVFSDLPHGFL